MQFGVKFGLSKTSCRTSEFNWGTKSSNLSADTVNFQRNRHLPADGGDPGNFERCLCIKLHKLKVIEMTKKQSPIPKDSIIIDDLEVKVESPWTHEELLSNLTTTSSCSVQVSTTSQLERASDSTNQDSS